MKRIKAWIKNTFGFSRSESNGFLILLPLMVVILFSAPVYRWWFDRTNSELPVNTHSIDSLIATLTWELEDSVSDPADSLFSFDPNTVPRADLAKLGLSERLSQRIVNFRSKGGTFRTKKDFAKIFGLDSTTFARLYPFINLPEKFVPSQAAQGSARHDKPRAVRFDLNQADTSQLISIYGIGPKRSLTIIKYRERLGGFVTLDQLSEVYGLDTAVIAELRKKTFIQDGYLPRQINLNKVDEKTLSAHPYIRFNLAKAITAYRFQHGEFSSIEQLRQLAILDEPTYQKIKPYLTLKD